MAQRRKTSYALFCVFGFGVLLMLVLMIFIKPPLVFCQGKDKTDKISDKNIEKPELNVLYVDAASKSKNADGSKGLPFSSLRQAFSYIKSKGLRSITIYLEQGKYREKTITLPCHIRILPAGKLKHTKNVVTRRPLIMNTKIVNQDGYDLEIQNISFDACSFEIKNNAKTIITDADFSYAPHCAVKQQGGRLKLINVAIIRTKGTNQQEHSGTAILLTGGVTAVLDDLLLANNEDGALRIEGGGSKVYAHKVTVKENGCRRTDSGDYTFGIGAVEVSKGAVLFMENSTVINNEFLGVFIFEGGKAHIRNTTVEGTKSVATAQGEWGGANISVCQKTAHLSFGTTELELAQVTTKGSAFCGLQIIDAWIRCQDVTITGNVFGLNIMSPNSINTPCLDECFDNCPNYNNEVDYSMDILPVPDAGDALDMIDGSTSAEPTDSSCCAQVSFEIITLE
ncbi:MAG: hypothetical protein JW822_07930 [Spirochaetales bacterium]|nr:hypothetical protein [Spirochaetales bacterium]